MGATRDEAIAQAMGMREDDDLYREIGDVVRRRVEEHRVDAGVGYWTFWSRRATRQRLIRAGIVIAGLTAVALLVLGAFAARSEEASPAACPPSARSCKVLVLTPEEEQALMQPRGVLDTAREGRPLDLGPIVAYFREKITRAPQGVAPASSGPAGIVPPEAVPVPRPRPPEAPQESKP